MVGLWGWGNSGSTSASNNNGGLQTTAAVVSGGDHLGISSNNNGIAAGAIELPHLQGLQGPQVHINSVNQGK